jgi:hypothetical protein
MSAAGSVLAGQALFERAGDECLPALFVFGQDKIFA